MAGLSDKEKRKKKYRILDPYDHDGHKPTTMRQLSLTALMYTLVYLVESIEGVMVE